MTAFLSMRREASAVLRLAIPIFIAQLALTSLGVVDTLMSGWVGVNDLAAIGLGSSILLPIFMFTTGVLIAITPMTASFLGNNQLAEIGQNRVQGLWLVIPLSIINWLLLTNPHVLLNQLNLDSEVYRLTVDYLYWVAWGLPGVALFQVYRFFLEGLGVTLPTLTISVTALLLNIPLNALFIYGFGPIEAMGAVGAGVATAIVMWVMFALAWLYVTFSPATQIYRTQGFILPSFSLGTLPIVKLGLPIAFSILFEVGMFSFIVLFIAPLGTVVIGAHQVAMSFTSLLFMLPLSLGMALTIRVGRAYGSKDKSAMLLVIKTGLVLALGVGGGLALNTIFWRESVVDLYTQHSEVVAIAVTLFLFAASYQVFDAIQISIAGILRGFHDTVVTMWATFVTYWGLGLGGGYILAFKISDPWGIYGFWFGIIMGLFGAAVLLALRLFFVYRRFTSAN